MRTDFIMTSSLVFSRKTLAVLFLLAVGNLAQAVENPPPALGGSPENYRLRPTDKVEIIVYGQDDLTSVQRISGKGTVKMSLLGEVPLAGLTARQAELFLESRFISNKLLRNPDITISVQEYSERTITVLGQVHHPGQVVLSPEAPATTISKVIAAAGGFTRLANTRKVKVVRVNATGERQSWEVNVKDLLAADSEEAYFTVYPGDVINVKERLF